MPDPVRLLRPVLDTPNTVDILRDALAGLDDAERLAAQHRRLIAELGEQLWRERNPGQKLYGRLRIEQLRGMVGAA